MYSVNDAAEAAGSSQVGADGTLGLFYNRAVLNEARTEIEGRPVYETVPFIKMQFPASGKKVVDRAVQPEHKGRFPQAWRAFEEGQAGIQGGTPIEAFPPLNVAQVATMRHLGIVTVEQLAAVTDGGLGGIGVGAMALRDRAKTWLQGDAAELKSMREQMAEMKAELAAMKATKDALERQKKLKPEAEAA